ncbi:MAG: hypothetical protein RML46_03215 [Anaerolineae bacterium]|nr:hypothetical protein [Anaerolineae bacterium]MDW8067905.1 hypothetical protein [Anaerolineae bacterium]
MAPTETVTMRVDQIKGLRDLTRQVIEEERLFPREYLIDWKPFGVPQRAS